MSHNFFHKLTGAAAGALGGFVRGGPLGAIAGGARGFTGTRAPPRFPGLSMTTTFAPDPIQRGPQGPNLPAGFPGTVPEPGGRGRLQRFLPGGQTGFTGAPPGFHVNKAYLRHLQAQQTGRRTQNPFDERRAVNVIVRNRKPNPLNPRALRRANARQVAAVRLMRRTLRGTGYTIARPGFGRKKTARR